MRNSQETKRGLEHLSRFAKWIRKQAVKWLLTEHVQAKDTQHKIDIAMGILRITRMNQGSIGMIAWRKMARRYPQLAKELGCDIRIEYRDIREEGWVRMEEHKLNIIITQLITQKLTEDGRAERLEGGGGREEQDNVGEGTAEGTAEGGDEEAEGRAESTTGQNRSGEEGEMFKQGVMRSAGFESLENGRLTSNTLKNIKKLFPQTRWSIDSLEDPMDGVTYDTPEELARILTEEMQRRQGTDRGEEETMEATARHTTIKLDDERLTQTTSAEWLEYILSSKNGKRPGPDGIPGEYFKMMADLLVSAFKRAFEEMTEEQTGPAGDMKLEHHSQGLYIPLAKIQNPQTIKHARDLEIPNECHKILNRGFTRKIEEAVQKSAHRGQQAALPGRDIGTAVFEINRDYYTEVEKERERGRRAREKRGQTTRGGEEEGESKEETDGGKRSRVKGPREGEVGDKKNEEEKEHPAKTRKTGKQRVCNLTKEEGRGKGEQGSQTPSTPSAHVTGGAGETSDGGRGRNKEHRDIAGGRERNEERTRGQSRKTEGQKESLNSARLF